jgi:hypothetical protein
LNVLFITLRVYMDKLLNLKKLELIVVAIGTLSFVSIPISVSYVQIYKS